MVKVIKLLTMFVLVFASLTQAVGQDKKSSKIGAAGSGRVDLLGDPLPPKAVARIGTSRLIFPANNTPFLFTPDGLKVITHESVNRTLSLWEVASGQELQRFALPGQSMNTFTVSPDSKTLITGSPYGSRLHVWDLATGKHLREIATRNSGNTDLSYSKDGKILAVGGDNGVQFLDSADGKEAFFLKEAAPRFGVAVLADGHTFLSAASKGLTWFDLETKKVTRHVDFSLAPASRMEVSPDGRRFAVLNDKNQVCLWDAGAGEETGRSGPVGPEGSSCFHFAPDGQTIVCRLETGGAAKQKADTAKKLYTAFLDAVTGNELRRWEESEFIAQMALTPDGKNVWQTNGRLVTMRDALTGKPALNVPRLPDEVLSLRFSPDGKALTLGCASGAVGSWIALSGQTIRPPQAPPKGFAKLGDRVALAAALSPDTRRAALKDGDSILQIWDLDSQKILASLDKFPVSFDQADFSADGRLLIVKHADNALRVWDWAAVKPIATYPVPGGGKGGFGARLASQHVFSPDGTLVALPPFGAGDCTIRLWHIPTDKEIGRLTWPDRTTALGMAFSPDGKYLATTHNSENAVEKTANRTEPEMGVRIWDVAEHKEVRRIDLTDAQNAALQYGRTRALVISPDGKLLAAALDKDVFLWDMASSKQLGELSGHGDTVQALAFSPDGRLLASGSADFTALVWDVAGFRTEGK